MGNKVGSKMNTVIEKKYFLLSNIFKILGNITGNLINDCETQLINLILFDQVLNEDHQRGAIY
jgi:hypothetical protein